MSRDEGCVGYKIERTDEKNRAKQKTRIAKRRKKNKLRMATWNVRSLKQNGKLENVMQEMERMEVDIMGISETFYKEDFKNELSCQIAKVTMY